MVQLRKWGSIDVQSIFQPHIYFVSASTGITLDDVFFMYLYLDTRFVSQLTIVSKFVFLALACRSIVDMWTIHATRTMRGWRLSRSTFTTKQATVLAAPNSRPVRACQRRIPHLILNVDQTRFDTAMLYCLPGDDASDVRWIKLSGDLKVYASHIDFLKLAAKKHNAHW